MTPSHLDPVQTVLRAQLQAALGDSCTIEREHSGCIDLLLTDVGMPEMGGKQLVILRR